MSRAKKDRVSKSSKKPKAAMGRGKKKKTKVKTSGSKKKTPVNRFHQRLGSLTYYQACTMLGEDGAKRIRQGGRFSEIDPGKDVFLGGDLLRIVVTDLAAPKFHGPDEAPEPNGRVITTLTLKSARAKQIETNCDHCGSSCHHLGAALDYLLDAKSVLGLAVPPDESVPLEHLTEQELIFRAMAEREQRADEEPMRVKSLDASTPWADYVVTSQQSGKTYRVALRGAEPHTSYCSCPDFRTNGLGSCKHILHVLSKCKKRFGARALTKPYRRKRVSVRLHYGVGEDGEGFGIRFNMPHRCKPPIREIVGEFAERSTTDAKAVIGCIERLEEAGFPVTIYPDAEDYLHRQLISNKLSKQCAAIRRDPENHPLRTELLNAELLPYQLDGIAFAASKGRAILADDMGLGKTIQGIGVAELLAQSVGIRRVLVICPASLKSQWRDEVLRFSGRSVQLVLGTAVERREQYRSDTFITVCNYEQVLRDLEAIETVDWDLIILDEGQRIKNWESKTSGMIRSLESPFRLVLSGTPLENHLGELFTVAQFVDEQRLGPAFRFFNLHRVVDERGRAIGYQNLDKLRSLLEPILLRRTRGEVAKQLPDRFDEVVRVMPTEEQLEIHSGQIQIAAQIVAKPYFTEMDLLRLRRALAMARMACDSTFLVNQEEPEYSSKLERLHELLEGLLADPARKIVIFSEWKRMLDRVERRLDMMACDYVRLDGSVPQKKRPPIVNRFQDEPDCRIILMTNAGATGLNLQSANVVINCDLPWNPAVLEQRIARAHRMGQQNPVHIYNLVSQGTIEEQLLDTLSAKQKLADASLDFDSDVRSVDVASGSDDLRRRLEKMSLPGFTAPVDASRKRRVEQETERLANQREGISRATGDLVSAAMSLAGNLLTSERPETPEQTEIAEKLTSQLLQTVEVDEQGRPQIKITLADKEALRTFAKSLAKLIE